MLFKASQSWINSNKYLKKKSIKQVSIGKIDKSGAQADFDGAYKQNPFLVGLGAAIHLNDSHVIMFKASLNNRTNNFAKLSALKLLLVLLTKKFLASLVVTNWM